MMKKVIYCGLLLFLLTIFTGWCLHDAYGQEWVTANQATVAWDAVTTLTNGSVIPEEDIIEYAVYLVNAVTDPDKMNPAEVETVASTNCTVTLSVEGRYFVGLKTIRKSSDGTVIGESIVVWSDNPEIVANGDTFGLQYFFTPSAPAGLRVTQ